MGDARIKHTARVSMRVSVVTHIWSMQPAIIIIIIIIITIIVIIMPACTQYIYLSMGSRDPCYVVAASLLLVGGCVFRRIRKTRFRLAELDRLAESS